MYEAMVEEKGTSSSSTWETKGKKGKKDAQPKSAGGKGGGRGKRRRKRRQGARQGPQARKGQGQAVREVISARSLAGGVLLWSTAEEERRGVPVIILVYYGEAQLGLVTY